MSKERLEEIKQRLVLLHNAADVDDETKNYIFEGLKVEWFIERVQELEEKLIEEKGDYDYLSYHYGNETEQNKRYRATINAMRQILKDAIHSLDVGEKVQGLEYGVKMASEALEGEK